MKSKDNIIKFISDIEIKKDPELANTIKNNLMVFYSWLLENDYIHVLPTDKEIESMFFISSERDNKPNLYRIEGCKHLRDVLAEQKKEHFK
jgi:hypothetical protein